MRSPSQPRLLCATALEACWPHHATLNARMPNESTIIFGIEIPRRRHVVGFHIAVGLAAVVAGMMAMFSKKGRGRHSAFGEVYFWLLLMIFVSATFLAAMR